MLSNICVTLYFHVQYQTHSEYEIAHGVCARPPPATTGHFERTGPSTVTYTSSTGQRTTLPLDGTSEGGPWLTILDQTNSAISVNPGQAIVDELFWTRSTGVVAYLIKGKVYNYYQRLTLRDSFNLYSNLAETWASANNRINTDFRMYSTHADLVAGRNPWQFCNYDDPGVGYPRDCAPERETPCLWTEFHGPELPYDNGPSNCNQGTVSFKLHLQPGAVPQWTQQQATSTTNDTVIW
jgi:hypothetical protein